MQRPIFALGAAVTMLLAGACSGSPATRSDAPSPTAAAEDPSGAADVHASTAPSLATSASAPNVIVGAKADDGPDTTLFLGAQTDDVTGAWQLVLIFTGHPTGRRTLWADGEHVTVRTRGGERVFRGDADLTIRASGLATETLRVPIPQPEWRALVDGSDRARVRAGAFTFHLDHTNIAYVDGMLERLRALPTK